MNRFRVPQTDAQAELIIPCIEEAEKRFENNDEHGAVFCQAKRDFKGGPVIIIGRYISEPYAKRIQKIMEEEIRNSQPQVSHR